MGKKLTIILIIIVAAVAIYFLESNWQVLSMLAAGLAGPFKLIWGFFGGGKEEEIRKKHAEQREREKQFQRELESAIQVRQDRIASLEDQVTNLDTQLSLLEVKRARVDQEVEAMSIKELQKAGRRAVR